jgi:hypothetical protein
MIKKNLSVKDINPFLFSHIILHNIVKDAAMSPKSCALQWLYNLCLILWLNYYFINFKYFFILN